MSYTHSEITGAYRHTRQMARILSVAEIAQIDEMGEAIEQLETDIGDIEAGSVADGAITDAKLAADVKMGSLAALTTTAKTSAQAAINEVDANANTAQAAVDALEAIVGDTALTTDAKTATAAINELDAANANMVTLAGVQALTNKTLTSPLLTTPKIADGDENLTITSANQTHASAVATVPNIGDAADEFVMKDTAQTVTNKTIDGDDNTLQDIATASLKSVTGQDTDVVTGTAGTSGNLAEWNADGDIVDGPTPPSGDIVGTSDEQTLTNKTLTAPVIDDGDAGLVLDSADQTNESATITVPDIGGAADNFVTENVAQTLTNKVLTDAAQIWTINSHDYEGAAADWTLDADDLLKPCQKVINANAAVNAIVADTVRPFLFINGSGYTLTVKTAAGSGIEIANSKAAMVMSDGTNVIRLTADA